MATLLFSEKYGKLEFDGLKGDFSLDNYNGNEVELSDCGPDELLTVLKAKAYNSKSLIQDYFNDCVSEEINWDGFDGDYESLINSSIDNSGAFYPSNFKYHFSK